MYQCFIQSQMLKIICKLPVYQDTGKEVERAHVVILAVVLQYYCLADPGVCDHVIKIIRCIPVSVSISIRMPPSGWVWALPHIY